MEQGKQEKTSHQLWAEFRFGVIGGLLSAPANLGELAQRLKELSETQWRHPITKAPIRFSIPTIERWYYAAKEAASPVTSLRRKLRCDAGTSRAMGQQIKEWLINNHKDHGSWSYQLHFDNLEAWLKTHPDLGSMPSYQSVVRLMRRKGLDKKPRPRSPFSPGHTIAEEKLRTREVRSFEAEYVGGLWHLDFHHGSRQIVTVGGERVTPLCLCVLDDCSRLACHIQWFLAEDTEALVHGFIQALQKRGLPRALLTDNGSAMISGEFTQGLSKLGITHATTLPYSPYQNGKQESFWGQLEGRLMAMLEKDRNLDLQKLNLATQAWGEMEYNRKIHSEISETPLNRFLNAKDVSRQAQDVTTLKLAFREDVKRKQRKSDGTFSLDGKRFEIPSAWRSLTKLTIRYAKWDLSQVHLVDDRTEKLLCAVYPVDKLSNSDGRRRIIAPPTQNTELTEDPPLLKKLIEEYSATGLPPAYLPLPNKENQ